MQLKEAIEILQKHNEWRRGSEIEPTDPKLLGIAIDTVILHMKYKIFLN